MSGVTTQIWTQSLTSSTLIIDEDFDLVLLSVLVTSGSCIITGSLGLGGLPSEGITLTQGQGMNITSNGSLLTGITIVSSGTTILSGR
jgi:hypothetical protein